VRQNEPLKWSVMGRMARFVLETKEINLKIQQIKGLMVYHALVDLKLF
jgi:hypothetical protein